jgi:hypothetical protein
MSKIDFIAARDGKLVMFAGDREIIASNDPLTLVGAVIASGGLDTTVRGSSTCWEAAENGWSSQHAFDMVWDKVCDLV